MNTIFAATKRNCIRNQLMAAWEAEHAQNLVARGKIDDAIHFQESSAFHAREAMRRLFSLIGTE